MVSTSTYDSDDETAAIYSSYKTDSCTAVYLKGVSFADYYAIEKAIRAIENTAFKAGKLAVLQAARKAYEE